MSEVDGEPDNISIERMAPYELVGREHNISRRRNVRRVERRGGYTIFHVDGHLPVKIFSTYA